MIGAITGVIRRITPIQRRFKTAAPLEEVDPSGPRERRRRAVVARPMRNSTRRTSSWPPPGCVLAGTSPPRRPRSRGPTGCKAPAPEKLPWRRRTGSRCAWTAATPISWSGGRCTTAARATIRRCSSSISRTSPWPPASAPRVSRTGVSCGSTPSCWRPRPPRRSTARADRHRGLLPQGSGAPLVAQPRCPRAPGLPPPSRRRSPRLIEYTLAMPAHYREGKYHVSLLRDGHGAPPRQGRGERREPRGSAVRRGQGGSERGGGGSSSTRRTRSTSRSPRAGPRPSRSALASVTFGKGRVLSRHFQVAAAPRLSAVPRGAARGGAPRRLAIDPPRSGRRPACAAAQGDAVALPGRERRGAHLRSRGAGAARRGFVPVATAIADLGKLPAEARATGAASTPRWPAPTRCSRRSRPGSRGESSPSPTCATRARSSRPRG